MGAVNQSDPTPIVTMVARDSDLKPRLRDDLACVAAGTMAALRPDRLLIAWVMLALLWLGGATWDASTPMDLPSRTETPRDGLVQQLIVMLPEEQRPIVTGDGQIDGRDLQAAFTDAEPEMRRLIEEHRGRGAFEYLRETLWSGFETSFSGMITLDPARTFGGFPRSVISSISTLWTESQTFFVLFGAYALLLLSVFGGAICRMDAERLARDRDVPMFGVVRWAFVGWRRLWGTSMLPPILVILLLSPIALLFGLLALVPGLDVLVAIGWVLALVPAFAAGILFVAWLVSLPFLVPAAAIEAGDPLEITVRLSTQIRRRPARVILILSTALLSGMVAWLMVSGVVAVTIGGANAALASVFDPIGPVPTPTWPGLAMPIADDSLGESMVATRGTSRAILTFWNGLLVSFAFAWIPCFLLHAATRGYLVLRRSVERLPFHDLGEPSPMP
jgi:hypothetical protein